MRVPKGTDLTGSVPRFGRRELGLPTPRRRPGRLVSATLGRPRGRTLQRACHARLIGPALRPGGWLGMMTEILGDDAGFPGWRYARDPTHVCFYRPETFRWIARRYGWELEFAGPTVVLLHLPVDGGGVYLLRQVPIQSLALKGRHSICLTDKRLQTLVIPPNVVGRLAVGLCPRMVVQRRVLAAAACESDGRSREQHVAFSLALWAMSRFVSTDAPTHLKGVAACAALQVVGRQRHLR
jgi:hypothetical protein